MYLSVTHSLAHAQHVSELFELHAPSAQTVFHRVRIFCPSFFFKALPDLFAEFTCPTKEALHGNRNLHCTLQFPVNTIEALIPAFLFVIKYDMYLISAVNR